MLFDRLASWSSYILPPILVTWGGAAIGTLLNPFTANQLCKTVSKVNSIIPCSIGAIGLLTYVWNAKLHKSIEVGAITRTDMELSQQEIVSEKVWHSTRYISYLVSGIAIGSSAMELSELIFFCNLSTSSLSTITTAVQLPFLAIAIWNCFTLKQIKTPPLTIEITHRNSISSVSAVGVQVPVVVDWA
jgi:hypothetical protein